MPAGNVIVVPDGTVLPAIIVGGVVVVVSIGVVVVVSIMLVTGASPPPPPHAASPSVNTVAMHSVIKFFCVDIFEALLLRRSGPVTRPS